MNFNDLAASQYLQWLFTGQVCGSSALYAYQKMDRHERHSASCGLDAASDKAAESCMLSIRRHMLGAAKDQAACDWGRHSDSKGQQAC